MPTADVVEALTRWRETPDYTLYRDYYDGKHAYKFATKKFIESYQWVLESARENMCPAVVSAFTDALDIASWGDEVAIDEAVAQGIQAILPMVWREAFMCGDAYILVWPNSRGEHRPRFNRADHIIPKVDPDNPDRLLWAAKPIITSLGENETLLRVNIYYADRLERFALATPLARKRTDIATDDWQQQESAWHPYSGDGEPDVIYHDYKNVPVCWFKRDALDQMGFGRSVLSDVIPIQDEHNKFVADLIVASERIARPIRYVLGMSVQDDPHLVKSSRATTKYDPTRSDILAVPGVGPAGEFPGPDAEQLVLIQNHTAQKIARVSGIPTFWFSQAGGDVPSGESLRVLSTRRTAVIRAFQRDNTPALIGMLALLGINSATVLWADPMPLGEVERYQVALQKKSLGYALTDIVSGLGETDIDGIVGRATDASAASVAAMGKALRDGQVGF